MALGFGGLAGGLKSDRLISSKSRPMVDALPQLIGGFCAARTITNPYRATTTTNVVAVADTADRRESCLRSAIRTNPTVGRSSIASGQEDPSPTPSAAATPISLPVVGRDRQSTRR